MSKDEKKKRWIARVLDSPTVSKIAPWTWVLWRRTTRTFWGTGYRAGEKPPFSGDLLVQSPYTDWYNLTWGLAPNQDMPKWRWMYRSRPEIKGGIDKKTILSVGKGFGIVCEKDQEIEAYVARLMKILNVKDVLQSAVSDMLIYGQSYFEKVRTTGADKQEGEEIQETPEQSPMYRLGANMARRVWNGNELDTNDPTEATTALRDWVHDVGQMDRFLADNANRMEDEVFVPKASAYRSMLDKTLRKADFLYQTALYMAGLTDKRLKRFKAAIQVPRGRNIEAPKLREEEFQAPEGELVELKPIDPLWMRINRDSFGNIIGFVQWGLTPIPQAVVMEKLVYLRWMPKSWAYECHTPETMIWSNPRPIGVAEMVEGTKVLHADGTYGHVEALRQFETDSLVEIWPSMSNNKLRMTPTHRLLVSRNITPHPHWKRIYSEPDFLPAEDIQKGDRLVIRIDRTIENRPSISDDLLYLAGFYLAEGSIDKRKINSWRIALWFNEKEQPAFERIKHFCESNGIKHSISHRPNLTGMEIYSENLALYLNEFGRGAENKMIPAWAMKLPSERQKVLLDALWLGDGTRIPSRDCLTTVSKTLAYQVHQILLRLNTPSAVYNKGKRFGGIVNGRPIIQCHDAYHIVIFRGHRRNQIVGDYCYVTVRKVQSVNESSIVYGLDVDGDETYTFDLGYISHNSAYGTSALMPVQRHVSMLIQAEEDMKVFWHQYAKPMLHVAVGTPEKPYPVPAIGAYVSQFKNRQTNTDVITPGDVTIKPISALTGETANTFEKWVMYLRQKIYETLAIPDVLMNLPGEMTRATSDVTLQAFIAEEEMIQAMVGEQILKQVIEPEVRRHFLAKYPDGQIPDVKIVWPPILEEDRNKKIDRLNKSVGVPFETINEARAEVSLPPLDDPSADEVSKQAAPGLGTPPSKSPETNESQRTGPREEEQVKLDRGNVEAQRLNIREKLPSI